MCGREREDVRTSEGRRVAVRGKTCGRGREDVRPWEGRCAAVRGIQNKFETVKAFV